VKSHSALKSDAACVWTAALRAADSECAIRKSLKRKGSILQIHRNRIDLDQVGKVWILGAGKAAAPMGRATEKILGRYVAGGILVTKYDHSLPLKRLEVLEAGHPWPDLKGINAGNRIVAFAKRRIKANDLVICLFSGGASALLVSPVRGIALKDKLNCTRLLMNGGADIHELNAVRKHLSNIKGGGLARLLAPARIVSLVLSDVVGDDVGTIASGPVSPDSTTFGECLEIFHRLQLLGRIPPAVRKRFEKGAAGQIEETPKPEDPVFGRSKSFVIGSSAQACAAAAYAARRLGYRTLVLTSRLRGDNGEAARFHMSVAGEIVFHGRPLRRPACVISGGETTVKVTGKGKGGRNQEFALHCVRQLGTLPALCLVASLGTDGTDGPTEAAGAVADNTTFTRSMKHGSSFLNESLRNNDSYTFFQRLDDLIITGPTRTNVMDLHIILIA
jgi:glycerate 2-kinase